MICWWRIMKSNNKAETFYSEIFLLFFVAVIAYLPLASRIGYLNDDWYLMYDMQVKGSAFFREIFSIDRPGRALLMEPLFNLLGFDPFFYHLSAVFFRAMGGVFLFLTIRTIWESRRFFAVTAALLFVVYPGFLSMPNAIDYQSHIVGLFLAMLSVAWTVRSLVSKLRVNRYLLGAGAIVAGWAYLSQMEYFIGVEVFRFVSITLLIWRIPEVDYKKRVMQIIAVGLPYLMIAGGFLFWRLFIFESERQATDVGLQVSQVFASPIVALWWLNYLIQDLFTVTLVAWNLPLYQQAFILRLKDILAAFAWAFVGAGGVVMVNYWIDKKRGISSNMPDSKLIWETLFLGLTTLVGGLIPVILVNRHVILPDYSRYSLIPSVGAVMLLALVVESIFHRGLRFGIAALLVLIAVLTHYGNAVKYVSETAATQNFWWQVFWRAPGIERGATLIASYPGSPLAEDYFVWGPANLIYFPEKQSGNPVIVNLPAAVLDGNTITKITTNGGVETPLRRGNYLERDFGNVLVLVQSSSDGCVRVLNGVSPELNSFDDDRVARIAGYSRLENVLINGSAALPKSEIFGKEPDHGWCYYYQKADLARQRGNWIEIPRLLDEALSQGHYPNDRMEWMPFFQAYAVLGDVPQMQDIAKKLILDKYTRLQVCGHMQDLMEKESLSVAVKDFIEIELCGR